MLRWCQNINHITQNPNDIKRAAAITKRKVSQKDQYGSVFCTGGNVGGGLFVAVDDEVSVEGSERSLFVVESVTSVGVVEEELMSSNVVSVMISGSVGNEGGNVVASVTFSEVESVDSSVTISGESLGSVDVPALDVVSSVVVSAVDG